MSRVRYFWRVIADCSAILGFGLSLFIACRIFPNHDNLQFDYQAILIGILAGLFTLIVGWNIYQMIDWKNELLKFAELKESIDYEIAEVKTDVNKEINYLHNKADFNQAMTYAFLGQNAAVAITDKDKESIKDQMLNYGITALVQLSRFPDTVETQQSVLSSLVSAMEQTPEIKLAQHHVTDYMLQCGKIERANELKDFEKFVMLIQKSYTSEL